MIRTLPTDLTTSWTSVQSSTTNRTAVVNSDGTFDCGHNYYNLIHEIQIGNTYTFVIDFNNTIKRFHFGFIRFNNDAIQNLVSFSNSTVSDPSDLTTGDNRLVLTVASDGKVTVYFKTDSYEVGTVYSGNPYRLEAINFNANNTLTVNSIQVSDSVLSSTEINTILGNGGGAMTNYTIAKTGSMHENNLSTIFPTCTTNNDGSLHVGSDWILDNFQYNSDTDWIVNMELQINTLNSSMLGIYGITDLNGGLFNIHRKWIDYDDNTDIGTVRINLNQISYGDNSTLQINITKNEDTLTWKLTDDNGNTQTVVLNNYSTTSNERFSMRCTGATTDIDMISYTRLTKLED